MKSVLLAVILLSGISIGAFANNIYVKYRGSVDVDNGHFQKINLKNSSLVKNIYYDESNKYLLVRLKNTYYHYCSIPSSIVTQWQQSPSLGRYYNHNIKGNYDCRVNPVPSY
ncbi:KTSC domain-containing protein [Sulfurovum sp. CS9]|uniref:KTSC domain-containing protein n=1 Tax=Sulfurovum sp. CS9 TaxID=3391146 RepID=UPI0039EAE67F